MQRTPKNSGIMQSLESPNESPIYSAANRRRRSLINSSRLSTSSIVSEEISEEDQNMLDSLNTSLDGKLDPDTSLIFLKSVKVDPNASFENLDNRQNSRKHNTLTKLMLSLGFNIDDDGLCYGFNTLAGLAIQVGEFDEFKQRVDRILERETTSSIVKALKKIKKKLRKSETLTDEDKEYINFLIFFQNINIAQSPFAAREMLESSTDINQGSVSSMQLIESIAMHNKGGRRTVFRYAHTFSYADIVEFLKGYQNLCTSDLKLTQPITLNFSAIGHSIGVTFLPDTTEWIFIDANDFNDPKTNPGGKGTKNLPLRTKNIEAIAERIFNGYIDLVSPDITQKMSAKDKKEKLFLTMTIEAYTTGDNKAALAIKNPEKLNISEGEKYFFSRPEIKQLQTKKYSDRIGIQGETVLHAAARKPGCPVDLKLYQGLINKRNAKGDTPLMCACKFGNIEMIRKLLAAKADPNIPDNDGRTPLQYVILEPNNFDLIKLLVENNANDIVDQSGKQLIHEACFSGNPQLLELLLKHRLINLSHDIAYDPAEFEDSVDSIGEQSSPNTKKPKRHLLFCPIPVYALQIGRVDFAKYLFEHKGIDRNASIRWAIEHKDGYILSQLIEIFPDLKAGFQRFIEEREANENAAQGNLLENENETNLVEVSAPPQVHPHSIFNSNNQSPVQSPLKRRNSGSENEHDDENESKDVKESKDEEDEFDDLGNFTATKNASGITFRNKKQKKEHSRFVFEPVQEPKKPEPMEENPFLKNTNNVTVHRGGKKGKKR